ncbi:MAG: site-2 protease family protein [Acidobacteria bacterium]|nr:site-2 protease family protein [Acidobacteriota bacterium]MBI3423975.1 site-2 protease family protein [Acidobacteriota bacterium]
MRFPQFQLARLFGIPLIIDYSWLPMAVLHVWLVAEMWLARALGDQLPQGAYLIIGVLVTALFFASILLHELAHALIARVEGIEIYDIQLHIFGGWARLVSEPRTALAELRIAIAGPASSFLLAALFWLGVQLVQLLGAPRDPAAAAAVSSFKYLAAANLTLALFNLLPGLPLDGGRALRAWLWHRRKDVLSATRTAKRCGVALAYLLMLYGVFLLGSGLMRGTFWREALAAAWLLVVGVFLKNAAEQDYRFRVEQRAYEDETQRLQAQTTAQWNVAGTVGAVMRTPVISVAPELKVSEFIDQVLAEHRLTIFPVAREGRLHGMLALERLRAVPKSEWECRLIRDVMEPVDETHFITVRASLAHAARKLKANPLGQLAVLDSDGLLVGCLSETDVSAAL